jgi:hypothetical protein
MKHLRPLLAGAVMALGGAMASQAAVHLCMTFADGTTAFINVQDGVDPENLPSMKIGDRSITVTVPQLGTEAMTYTYEASNLDHFNFAEMSGIAEIERTSEATITAMGGGLVRVSGANAGDVTVYDLAGRPVSVPQTTEGEATIISLDNLATGVYIVSYKSATLKITKK